MVKVATIGTCSEPHGDETPGGPVANGNQLLVFLDDGTAAAFDAQQWAVLEKLLGIKVPRAKIDPAPADNEKPKLKPRRPKGKAKKK